MTDIYLSHIRIQNFRTFGSFDVEIPAAPGLVILTGTNGLGKSSFFDAIEWGLTGFIRRFTPYVEKSRFSEGDYLTRRGAEANSHEVILTFSDGKPIVRSGSTTTPMASIVTQLAQSDRPAINDLGTYLALTHFLGQASQQRFTSRAPQDQWQALKGPSGMERLEQVRAGLRGRATTVAFTRRVDDEKSAVSEIERQIAEWQGWRARLDRLRQAARATGALATEEIADRANLLEIELIPKLREPVVPISGETLSQHLARLGDRIAQAIHEATEREGLLKGLEDIVTQFAAASARARADHPVLVRAQEDFNNSLQALTESNSRAQAAEAALEAQNKVIGAIEQKIAILESARADLSQRSELAAQIDEAQAELSGLLVIIAEHRAALTVAEAVVRKHSDAESEVARLRNIAQRTRGCVESYSTLLSLEAEAATNANILELRSKTLRLQRRILNP
jgi:DNA repair exonuclease SbcCD ATPase subunit